MAETAFVNASPWIHLSRAGCLGLLRPLAVRIVIPDAVVLEVRQKRQDASVEALTSHPWIEIVPTPAIPHVVGDWDLGAGEAAHQDSIAVLDDQRARRCAASLGVPTIGSLGVVLLARRQGRVLAARPILEAMVAAGMYLQPATLAAALALVGE